MLLLPAFLTAWFAWHHYQTVIGEAEHMAQRSVVALQEHTANVMDTHSMILLQAAAMTQGRSWQSIASDASLEKNLAHLASHFDQVAVIGMADSNGTVRVNSADSAKPISIADRDYFQVHKNGSVKGLFFSEVFVGRLTGNRQFAVSIARTDTAGAFDGIIYASIPLDYFTEFWTQFAPASGYLVPMIREDGVVLTRYPKPQPVRKLDPAGPFLTHIRQANKGIYTAVSRVDGIERINAYSQVKAYPLYISFSIEKRLITKQWRDAMFPAIFVGLAVMACMIALWYLVVQQSYRQRTSTLQWRKTAKELETAIARREDAEAALRQGQKMEALGQLAGGIAHDFNNLLTGVVCNLQLMRTHLVQGNLDAVSSSINAAESATDTATAITHRLLTFSRRESLTPSITSVNDRIVLMQQLITRTVGPTIAVRIRLTEEACNTLCDPNQLDTALLNLAINARDAIEGDGELRFATEIIRAENSVQTLSGDLSPGDYVLICVSDTGTGIQPEILSRVLEPFFTTKPAGQGTGLGLAMIFSFASESKGRIHIDSVPGQGTTVKLYLPHLP